MDCPLHWEPSGADFLSPCLEQAALVGKISKTPQEYQIWLQKFLPRLLDENFELETGKVLDRTDGYLVHLDGLNFSRAWSLYSIILSLDTTIDDSIRNNLMEIADKHIQKSIGYVVGADYAGSHWLASFLTHALLMREKVSREFPFTLTDFKKY